MGKKNTNNYGICCFISPRKEKKKCEEIAKVPWGYCTKHKNTVDGKKAQVEYEKGEKAEKAEKAEKYEKDNEIEIKNISSTRLVNKENPIPSFQQPNNFSITPASIPVVAEKPPLPRAFFTESTPSEATILTFLFDNYYLEKNTQIVFNKKYRAACGIYSSGSIIALTEESKKICHVKGWPYIVDEDYFSDD